MHIEHRVECVRDFAFDPELLFLYPVVTVSSDTHQNAQVLLSSNNNEEADASLATSPARYLLCQPCLDKAGITNEHRSHYLETIIEDDKSSCYSDAELSETGPDFVSVWRRM